MKTALRGGRPPLFLFKGNTVRKVLITDEIETCGIEEYLGGKFEITRFYGHSHADICLTLQEGYDALIVRTETQVDEVMLDYGTNLKVIGRAGVGLDNIDVKYAESKGITVFNTPEANTISAAEHTMGMMLALCRHIPQATGGTRQGRWERQRFMGIELREKTLGIIGTGRVGGYVAKLAMAFGMKILGYDHHQDTTFIGEYTSLDTLLLYSDIVTLHVPLNDQTRNILSWGSFPLMKTNVRIINCARGGLVEQDALLFYYDEGVVAGYATDVFEGEPVIDKDHPFYSRRFITCTPHIGAMTYEAQERVSREICRKVVSFFVAD